MPPPSPPPPHRGFVRPLPAALALLLVSRSVTAQSQSAAPVLLVHDTFDGVALRAGGDYGLNAALRERQTGRLAPATYTLLPGVWFSAPPAASETARVGFPLADGRAGRLSFHGFTAVQLDAPIALGNAGSVRIAATMDPMVGDTASMTWLSIIVTPVRESLGWVRDERNVIGLMVRSNGEVGLAAYGADVPIAWTQAPPNAAASYRVVLTLRAQSSQTGRELSVAGAINDAAFTARIAIDRAARIPPSVLVDIGAHFHEEGVSWVDDLDVSGAPGVMPQRAPTPSPPPESHPDPRPTIEMDPR